MPFYEYICDEGHEFEVEQRITEDTLTECTEDFATRPYFLESPFETGNFYFPVEGRVCKAPCRRLISDTSFTFKDGPPTPKYHT